MKIIFRTFVFHVLSIIIFSFIYQSFKNDYYSKKKPEELTYIDFFELSTTIQAGVGFSDLLPKTHNVKYVLCAQQLCMICTHIITLYFFTL
jgi:hypothetical protein